MIVEEKKGIVKSSGIMDTTQFSIEASAKMFSMLTNALYSNKIQSVVREISSNAFDAHTEAGHSEPIEVHAPTYNEPYFSVRDYGLGMSPDKIKTVYTVLGKSDKTESNEYMGCLGVGSKSPFAYTNNFSVTSIHEGIKREYACYINEEGIPAMSLLAESESKERSGLQVKMAVKISDFHQFEQCINKNYRFYSVLPKCNIKLDMPVKILDLKMPGFEVLSFKHNEGSGKVMVLMGHNIYTLDKVFAGIEFDVPYHSGMVISVPIGTLNIDVSRERLSFDQKTTKTLTDICVKIKDHLLVHVQADINQSKSKFEAVKKSIGLNGIKLKNYYTLLTYNKQTIQEIMYETWKSTVQTFAIDNSGKARKIRSMDMKNDYVYVLDDDKVSLSNIKKNYFELPNATKRGYFIKAGDEVQKVVDELETFGIPKDYLVFTSSLKLKTPGKHAPTKMMKIQGGAPVQVMASPGKQDYYVARKGNQAEVSGPTLKIFQFLGIDLYALTPTQVKKYGCKDAVAELPNLIEAYLKKHNIQVNYYGIDFGSESVVNELKVDFPEFIQYFKMKDEFVAGKTRVEKLLPHDIRHTFLSKVPNKTLDIDGEIYGKYPLLKSIHVPHGGLDSVAHKDLVFYVKEKNRVISGN